MILKNTFKNIYIIGSGKLFNSIIKFFQNKKITNVIAIQNEKVFFNNIFNFRNKKIKLLKIYKKKKLNIFFKKISNKSLIISANNNYIFKKEIYKKKKIQIINFHNSLLPKYRGRNIYTWVIFNKEKYTGVTWHLIGAKIDTGYVVIQKKIKISNHMTAYKLLNKSINLGINMFPIVFKKIQNGEKVNKIINNKKKVFRSNNLPNNSELDLKWNINKIYIFLRAFDYQSLKVIHAPFFYYENKKFIVNYFKYTSTNTKQNQKSIVCKNKYIHITHKFISIRIFYEKRNI